MDIDFYEEYPTKKNLEKLKFVKFPTRIFVAAKSLEEFKKLENQIKKIKKDVVVAYWPLIKNSYWISPFSNTKDLVSIFKDLERINNPLLIDLELPLKRKMIIKNLSSFSKNRKIIKKFLEKNKKRIATAEFPSSILSPLMKAIGRDFPVKTEKSLMWYSSMNPLIMNKNIKKHLAKLKNKQQYSISLGTIATGILGTEPILPPKQLEEDLKFVKKAGFEKIIIFRLGGLNEEYIKVLKKFK